MEALYYAVGLTPYRAVLLHLVLIGIPLRFGLLPTGWGRGWLYSEKVIDDPCSIFGAGNELCFKAEENAIRDSGVRFILHYELAWVVWVVMRSSTRSSVIAFHKVLLGTSFASILILSWIQNYLHPSPWTSEFNQDFFTSMVFFHLTAIAVSMWTLLIYPEIWKESMEWSIPANAIFCGAVVNAVVAAVSFYLLMERSGIERYYIPRVSPVIRMSFAIGAFHTAIHAVLLLRIRTFLNVPQLRAVCLYKVIVNLVLPFFWFPEMGPNMQVDHRITLTVRCALTLIYLLGYLWAGKARGVGRIVHSVKGE